MQKTRVKLLTVVAEAVVEERLVRELEEPGARGYILGRVHGQGSRGRRVGDVEGANVRIETLVAPEVADRIRAHLRDHYFERFALVAFVEDVSVVRGEKYV